MDQSIDDLFPDKSQDIRTAFEREKPWNEKTTRKTKRKEKEKVYGQSRLWILYTKNWLSQRKIFKKQVTKTSNGTQSHRNVAVHKKKENHAEIVKLNNSERRQENKESLDTVYEKSGKVTTIVQEKVALDKICNGNKEEYCDVTKESSPDSTFFKGTKKAENTFKKNLSSSDEDILTNLD